MLDSWAPRGPLLPGVRVEPRSGTRLEKKKKKKKTPEGAVSSVCCRFIRSSGVFGTKKTAGCPFCICPTFRDHAETPAEAAGHAGAQIPSGRAGPKGWGRSWGGARSGLAGVGTARGALCPQLSLSHGPPLSLPGPHILPIRVLLLGGSRLPCLIPVRSYFNQVHRSNVEAAAGLPALPAGPPPTPSHWQTGPEQFPGVSKGLRRKSYRACKQVNFPPPFCSHDQIQTRWGFHRTLL